MPPDIVAPEGAFVSVVTVGVEDMAASLRFYRDLHGLDADAPVEWKGADFERFWHLPPGSSATAVFLHAGASEVGRILLLDFHAKDRLKTRANRPPRAYGLFNLNFYTDDIWKEYERFRALGYEFWSEPVQHKFEGNVGAPIEVVFEGPDGVVINWVELAATDPTQGIGRMKAFVEKHGRTRTGFTPVVTTASCMKDIQKARAFYQDVLKMGIHIDQVLDSPGYVKFQRVPPGGRTHVTFMQGNHMFGKIAMSQPLNYPVPDMTPIAVAPNIGYLAQTFVVPDLAATERACAAMGVEVYTPRMTFDLPGLGRRAVTTVRNPGSGALQQLVQG